MSFDFTPVRTKSLKNVSDFSDTPPTTDRSDSESKSFEDFYPSLCAQFNTTKPIYVKRETIDEDAFMRQYFDGESIKSKRLVKTRTKGAATPQEKAKTEKEDSTERITFVDSDLKYFYGKDVVIFTARYDYLDRLREICIMNSKMLDELVMSVLTLIVHLYNRLRKISISNVAIEPEVICQINKIMQIVNITEISFSDLILEQGNFYILLDEVSSLKSLSICRCKLNDEVCKRIFMRLEYPQPAELTVAILDLSSNQITNVGAKHIAKALRSNRHLRSLNLADNKLGDDGAIHIFQSFMEFPLDREEMEAKINRGIKVMQAYARKTRNFVRQEEFGEKSESRFQLHKKGKKGDNKRKTKPINNDDIERRLSMPSSVSSNYSRSTIGVPSDPFYYTYTTVKDNITYCTGNFTLVSLNLAYNDLSYMSAKMLFDVCVYQSDNVSMDRPGLFRVIVDGNRMPAKCDELIFVEKTFKKNIATRCKNL